MIIGIHGAIGSGKDTFADFLMIYKNIGKLSLADRLKKSCSILFGIPLEDFYDRDLKESTVKDWDKTPRELLQILGTDLLRDRFNPDIWIKCLEQDYKGLGYSDYDHIVVPDIRFENEAEWARKNGILVHIQRYENNLNNVNGSTHKSENGVLRKPEDIIIENSFDLLTLQNATDLFYKTHLKN